ncbi:MAG: bifunctional glutamate N-acetyltransferase/amino-acid acetyltransferase ArgJ [Gammaproteobacteria bacterium]|nr:MAG: bifunctional glutamate N-acetyltransferase/amino-acid acetyltransferase ArgJ [Gammaproteobacteria bacterium]
MPVAFPQLPEVLPVAGIRLASVAAGIRYEGRDDLVLMELAAGSQCAAVFTRNAFCAAPVVVARQHLATQQPRYMLINSGNANAGTGDPGIQDAQQICTLLAEKAGCSAGQVLPFSTGVIGERLPAGRIEAVLDQALAGLSADSWKAAAHAIMTTDTVAKKLSRSFATGSQRFTLTGMVKGAGMIRPDMATMLAFVACDAGVESGALQQCLNQAVERSFNRITVDGDTSTNDACVLVATGAKGSDRIQSGTADFETFCEAVSQICEDLAQLIVRDAEGGTKFVTVRIENGRDQEECLQVAYTIAHSPLVKTALFASDPNWGRILAAVGRAGVESMDIEKISIFLGDVCIVRNGSVAEDYREQDGQRVMSQEEIVIRVQLGRGDAVEQVWTSDLSHDYVRINAEYRT